MYLHDRWYWSEENGFQVGTNKRRYSYSCNYAKLNSVSKKDKTDLINKVSSGCEKKSEAKLQYK